MLKELLIQQLVLWKKNCPITSYWWYNYTKIVIHGLAGSNFNINKSISSLA